MPGGFHVPLQGLHSYCIPIISVLTQSQSPSCLRLLSSLFTPATSALMCSLETWLVLCNAIRSTHSKFYWFHSPADSLPRRAWSRVPATGQNEEGNVKVAMYVPQFFDFCCFLPHLFQTSLCLQFKLRMISMHVRSPQSILGSLLNGLKMSTNLEHKYCQTRSEQLSISCCVLVLTAETQRPSGAR